MQDNDFIMVRGASSLAEVVAVVVEAVDAEPPAPPRLGRGNAEIAYVLIEPEVGAAIQYDAVDDDESDQYVPDGDKETWPYMVTVESGIDGKSAAVRAASWRIVEKIRTTTGWRFQLITDLEDAVLAENAPGPVNFVQARQVAATAPSVRKFFGLGVTIADYGWENDDVYVVAAVPEGGEPMFDAPSLLVDKRTGLLREVYGLLGNPPAPGLRPIGEPPN